VEEAQIPSTRRGPLEQRDWRRREQLLEAGLEAFGTRGFADCAVESICADARVGTRSFYRYFESKADLLEAVYDRQIARVGSELTTALARHPNDLGRRVRAGVRAFVHATTSDERAARVQLIEVVGVSERLEVHRRGVLRAFAVLIEQEYDDLYDRGLIKNRVGSVVCMGLVGGSSEVLVDWIQSSPRPGKQRLVDGIVRLHLGAAR
jgi:AcrR family transcriptional regulator